MITTMAFMGRLRVMTSLVKTTVLMPFFTERTVGRFRAFPFMENSWSSSPVSTVTEIPKT